MSNGSIRCPPASSVKEALARAGAFMHSDPPGPVYMMLPRETLAEEWTNGDAGLQSRAAMAAWRPAASILLAWTPSPPD